MDDTWMEELILFHCYFCNNDRKRKAPTISNIYSKVWFYRYVGHFSLFYFVPTSSWHYCQRLWFSPFSIQIHPICHFISPSELWVGKRKVGDTLVMTIQQAILYNSWSFSMLYNSWSRLSWKGNSGSLGISWDGSRVKLESREQSIDHTFRQKIAPSDSRICQSFLVLASESHPRPPS